MIEALTIRAVVFEDQGRWLGQCLEYDLCTSAKDRKELTRKLSGQLRLQIMLDLAAGKKPFEGLPRAPQKFWDMYSSSTSEEILPIRDSWPATLLRVWRGRSGVQANIALAFA